MPLSILLVITNIGSSFPIVYCYITSKSRESFMFMFASIQELMFYDNCPGPYVLIGDFAAGLGATMMKAITRKENPDGETEFAWETAQVMDHTNTDCTLQLYTWYAAEAIKKNLSKLVAIP